METASNYVKNYVLESLQGKVFDELLSTISSGFITGCNQTEPFELLIHSALAQNKFKWKILHCADDKDIRVRNGRIVYFWFGGNTQF